MDSATAAGSGGQISGRSDGRMTGMPVQLATVPLRKWAPAGCRRGKSSGVSRIFH